MMTNTRTVKSAHSPQFSKDGKGIDLMVVFHELEHLGELPFTARPEDTHEHGAELHARAVRGEFGVVKP